MFHSRLAILALLTSIVGTSPLLADVQVVRAPRGAEVPEVVVDGRGVLHMTYGHGQPGDGFYVQSVDQGKTWSAPVKLNHRAETVTTGAERGPKLALGKDGAIHVIWLGFYKKGGGVWYTRSTDGGKTFEEERCLTEMRPGWDNATLAADKEGNVFTVWTGQWPDLPEDKESPVAAPIILTRSTDNGRTFAPSQLVKHDYPGRACGCCRLEARVGPDGNLYIAFRGGYHSLRDPFVLKGKKTENDFHVIAVSNDRWQFAGCPMSGMPFQVDASGRVLFAWMNREKVYWSVSGEGTKNFASPTPAPEGGAQAHPTALWGPNQEVLLVWKEGPAVRWAMYGSDGKLTDQGKAGTLPGTNKATAVTTAEGRFLIVF